ncbi:MAG: alpha/beta hydrolase domain-containing protein [Phenylobacterium sp.]
MKLLALIAACLALCMPAAAYAQADSPIPNPAALPLRVFDPPAGAGKAYSADPKLPPSYVEQEYLVSGRANIYGHDAAGRLVVEKADQPYTTRILVRRPRDRAKYSGVVIFDLMHPEAGAATLWGFANDYVVRNGDAYVQVTTRREARNPLLAGTPGPIQRLTSMDPVRYAPIDFPDGGLTWDIISQVGRLVRSDSPENPLRDFRPKQMLAGGWSGSGALTLFYINEGFADGARMPGGGPIFDGYLVGEPSWYPRVNSTVSPAQDIAENDPRQPVKPRDVPAISLYSMGFVHPLGFGRMRPDSDAPGDRYRLYLVPGAYHAGRRIHAGELSGMAPKCAYPGSTVPLDHYVALSLDYLRGWSQGKPPPHAEPLRLDDKRQPVFDANGNPQGGIRSTALDVPIARHFDGSGGLACSVFGSEERYPPEKLRQLYGSEAEYVKQVTARARELQAQGWLPAYAAEEVIRDAQAVRFAP